MTKAYNRLSLKSILLLLALNVTVALIAQNNELPPDVASMVTTESRPGWMEVNPETKLNPQEFLTLLSRPDNAAAAGIDYEFVDVSKNTTGIKKFVYQQTFQGIPIDNHILLLHGTNDKVFFAQTTFVEAPRFADPQPLLQSVHALNSALDSARADTYAWEVPLLEANLKLITNDPNATHFPKAELVWSVDKFTKELTLTYRLDIYSVDPIGKKRYYIDAKTGLLIRTIDLLPSGCFGHKTATHNASHICTHTTHAHADEPGTGVANFIAGNGGVVDITADFNGTDYTLSTNSLGPLGTQIIKTQNANNNWNYSNLTDFHDADNFWSDNPTAVGAHWGAQIAYKYFLDLSLIHI